jgi:hypothetical protein
MGVEPLPKIDIPAREDGFEARGTTDEKVHRILVTPFDHLERGSSTRAGRSGPSLQLRAVVRRAGSSTSPASLTPLGEALLPEDVEDRTDQVRSISGHSHSFDKAVERLELRLE